MCEHNISGLADDILTLLLNVHILNRFERYVLSLYQTLRWKKNKNTMNYTIVFLPGIKGSVLIDKCKENII